MTDNNNFGDFEPDHEPGGGLSPPSGGARANLAHAWRTRPLFKLLVLMIVVGAIIAVCFTLFSGSSSGPISKLAPPPTSLHQPAGGPASPYFVDQTKKAEEEREDTAIKTGGSALPTPIGQSTNIEEMTGDKQKKDPLVELRAQIEQQKQKIAQIEQQKQQPSAPPKPPAQFDDSLAQAMQKQMQQLMTSWEPKGIKQITTKTEDEDEKEKEQAKKNEETAATSPAGGASATASSQPPPKTIVSAGTVSYAQLLTEANSDVPGPILAQILSGPLTGARAVGEFKVSDEYLVLKFKLADLKGKDYAIDAIALDPDTTLGGMATEVDERWMSRVLLPAAAGFVQGFGSALGQNNSSLATNGTTTIVQQSGKSLEQGIFTGVGQAGQTMGEFFQNEANQIKPLVRVAAGTPMGLFFVSSVIDSTGQQPYPYYGAAGAGGGPGGGPGYGPMNGQGTGYNNGALPGGYYPGTSMNGYGYNGQFPGSGGTGPGSASNTPYPNANMPYNTSVNPGATPLSNPGILTIPNTSGIGTTVVNP